MKSKDSKYLVLVNVPFDPMYADKLGFHGYVLYRISDRVKHNGMWV